MPRPRNLPLVKPKGSKVENAYTETEGVDMVNEDSSENTKDKNTAVRTTIRDLLNAPETYKKVRLQMTVQNL